MDLQKMGGLAALFEAFSYIFGIVLFLVVLNPVGYEGAVGSLRYMTENSDSYILGLFVSGFLFSFALVVLVQAIHQRLVAYAPDLSRFVTFLGYFWASIVLASAMIEVVSIKSLVHYYSVDPEMALTVKRAVGVIAGGLGGDIELIGALWTGLISIIGLKYRLFNRWLNYLGLAVGLAGTLTLLAFLSAFSEIALFELMTLLFGLGQIPWFIGLGISLYLAPGIKTASGAAAD